MKEKTSDMRILQLVMWNIIGGGMEWEVGVSRWTLLYIEWINNKVLPYSAENYIQYPMINHNAKEYFLKRMYIYIYIYIYVYV